MKCFKITDENGKSRKHITSGIGKSLTWGPKITNKATGKGENLCSDGFIHWYFTPETAAIFNMIHGAYFKPILWECKTSGKTIEDSWIKGGSKSVTTIKKVTMPEISFADLKDICDKIANLTKTHKHARYEWVEKDFKSKWSKETKFYAMKLDAGLYIDDLARTGKLSLKQFLGIMKDV